MNNNELAEDEVRGHARAARDAVADLCRSTVTTPDMTPAAVADSVEALADLAAALPQAYAQITRVLDKALREQLLTMDTLTEENDPAMAVGIANVSLEEARQVAVDLHKLLNTAHQATAHIISHGNFQGDDNTET